MSGQGGGRRRCPAHKETYRFAAAAGAMLTADFIGRKEL